MDLGHDDSGEDLQSLNGATLATLAEVEEVEEREQDELLGVGSSALLSSLIDLFLTRKQISTGASASRLPLPLQPAVLLSAPVIAAPKW